MKILAIETSCEHASAALLIDDAVSVGRLEGHANHSEQLLPTLQRLLAESGVALSGLDAIAFGAGPGAFTGLRLACGVAQGLAMGAGLGVVPVSSLEALALQAEGSAIWTVTDARMGEVYSAAYVRDGDGLRCIAPAVCVPPEELRAPEGAGWCALGSGFSAYAGRIPAQCLADLAGCDAAAVPGAGEVARLGLLAVRQGAVLAPELAAPLYVRDKVALTTAERLARGGKA